MVPGIESTALVTRVQDGLAGRTVAAAPDELDELEGLDQDLAPVTHPADIAIEPQDPDRPATWRTSLERILGRLSRSA